MKTFLQRVLPGVFGEEADRRKAPRALATDRRQAPPPVLAKGRAAATQAAEAAAAAALVAVGARRPLIAASGEIVGFEFRVSGGMQQRLKRRTDYRGQAAHVSAVLTSARLMAQTERIGLARVPAEWLVHATEFEDAAGAWVGVELPGGANSPPALLQATVLAVQQLRQAGAKVGWEIHAGLDLAPDFVLLSQADLPMAAVLEAVRALPLAARAVPALVTDVATVEDLELALHRGLNYACGALAPSGVAPDAKDLLPVPPEVARVGQLLKQLVTGADTAQIVRELKSDVGLSYRLLRRINSAMFAHLEASASIDQAVMLLGRNELYRWLSMLLVQFAGRRKVSSALQEITLWRSRLLELLALQAKEEQPGQFFTLGLASMLGAILKISLLDVVDTLSLPDAARQALLEQAGPWYPCLQMVFQVEAHGVAEAPELADRFGGAERVLALSDEAWAWAWRAGHGHHDGP